MAIVYAPRHIDTPSMRADCDSYYRLPWTPQPGGAGVIHISIVGPGSSAIIPVETIEAAKKDALPSTGPVRPALGSARVLAKGATTGARIVLRDYQRECVDAVCENWQRGIQAPLVVLPTASGKTVIAASIMERAFDAGQRSLFIAHRKELLDQTAEKIALAASGQRPPRVGIVQGSRNQLGRDITVASMQTLKGGKRMAEVLEAGPYDVVFIDEAHHAPSKTYRRILDALRAHNPATLLAGLTATPGRADGLALDLVFDNVCYQRTIFEMIDLGYLVPIRPRRPHLDIRLEEVKVGDDGDYNKAHLGEVLNTLHVNDAMVQAWREFGEDRKTLVFAVDVDHARCLSEAFQAAGYSADYAWGQMKDGPRKKVLKRFSQGDLQILVNCELLTEGSDIPSIEAIMFARPTQSQALLIQCLGRGLRLHPGKKDCLVLDPVGNLARHELVQLASLAGFDPHTGKGGFRKSSESEDDDFDEVMPPAIDGVDVTGVSDIDLQRPRRAQYDWRETTLGWVLLVPSIGYYMVAWEGTTKKRATIRFYDQRPGRRGDPARDVVTEPLSFELAYGLVEGEMERFFRARDDRGKKRMKSGAVVDTHRAPREFQQSDDGTSPEWTFFDLDEGTDEALHVPEALMMKDALWRERPITHAQRELLIKLGGKKRTLPSTAGEASGLIAVLLIERDAKMRLPPTEKQLAYLRRNGLGTARTKGEAARMIWPHRRAQLERDAARTGI